MLKLNSPFCFPLSVSTKGSMRQLHEAEEGARPNQQCIDYNSFFSFLPHMMVHTRTTQGSTRWLRLESLTVSLLKEELETQHHPWRVKGTEKNSEIKSQGGNQTPRSKLAIPSMIPQLSPHLTDSNSPSTLHLLKSKPPGTQCLHAHMGSQVQYQQIPNH